MKYVTIEQAKLLEAKGFDEPCTKEYREYTKNHTEFDYRSGEDYIINKMGSVRIVNVNSEYPNEYNTYSWTKAPELNQVVEWLRLHNIDLHVEKVRALDNTVGYVWVIFETDRLEISKKTDTYEEACLKGIDYALTLIK